MRQRLVAAAVCLPLWSVVGIGSSPAADLLWEVESPFRLFKPTSSFALHEKALKAVRGDPNSPLPADIIWRLERRLNDPDCRDSSTPDKCAATRRARYEQSRLGWAAQTLPTVCFESGGHPRRYPTTCERKYSWGSAKEDYILPEAHTVNIGLAPQNVVDGDCVWSWQGRKAGAKPETRKLACKNKLTIARVPFALDRERSGTVVTVKLPDGRELSETVIVDDLLIVALGDSFASGESNPDRPVSFSGSREMLYDPNMNREDQVAAKKPAVPQNYGVASADQGFDPKVLPRRLLADEEKSLMYRGASREFQAAFEQRNARWFSADCHRSQYGYPFRVGIQLALENRHRSVTLVSLACSGAEVTEGLFQEMASREGSNPKVRAQFDQLAELMCRGGSAARTVNSSYTLPFYKAGSTGTELRTVQQRWCPPAQRKRAIDLVLMSIGGNDVGFGALTLYAMTESGSDLAPIAGLVGSQIRFAPDVARVYLGQLDKRLKAVKDALRDGFGVDPERVVQNAYEPIHYDETGALCGSQPTLGMDVHPNFKISKARLTEVGDFFRDFVKRLECTASSRRGDCPAGLATGSGTGFTLVTEHQVKFAKRGICARNPRSLIADGINMQMPRKSRLDDEFKPYSPDATLPYASRWRLFRTPNDAFLAANTHKEGISPFDILQPAYVGLISGAVHPTAEGHSMVADSVMTHARHVLDRRPNITIAPVTTGQRGPATSASAQ
jgi:hypothetical protein